MIGAIYARKSTEQTAVADLHTAAQPCERRRVMSDEKILTKAHGAISEAQRRAKARGLTDEEIEREGDDERSQFWDDLREIVLAKSRATSTTDDDVES